MKVTKSELEAAKRRADATLRGTPHATHVHYDRKRERIVIGLSSGIEVAFRPRDAQGLEDATPHQLGQIEISPSGLGIHFPRRDADIYLPALLEGFLGSKKLDCFANRQARRQRFDEGKSARRATQRQARRTTED